MAENKTDQHISDDSHLWYKDAIIYQLHVKTFNDSNGDGMGDFRGLTQKLDYLQDLGITALWLQPFCPSPLRDDGYDIADFTGVHPDYGTLRDFKTFLREAHKRNLRVITELVVNHTSDQHPWFQRARGAKPGSRWRDFYVWSDTPDRYKDARIIFQDFESSNWAWDHVAQAYYWHRFYSHQPDLNYDNPAVRKEILRVLDFWLDLGVDGLRLDAVPYLFEREGTNCENLPETHVFLKKMREHIDSRFIDKMILAEANQWPEDAVAYFGAGDECHMAFHFPLMPRLFMAIRMEDSFPIIDILDQTPSIPETSQWAIFLRNHDELTLEMVTDEERDFMYRAYARDSRARINLGIRRRLAPLLENNRRRIELMTCLLFSMPGTPVIYYGDEIGMGDNVYLGDRNGVRTPMQWSADRNAGFSRANPQSLYLPAIIDPEYHYEVVNVESQQKNMSSLFWWNKRLISLRKRIRAFTRGTIEFLQPDNHKILAFVRSHGDEHILVVANLSRFVQYTELDLSRFRGFSPMEVFGQTEFPAITDSAYTLTLGPHSFFWLDLMPQQSNESSIQTGEDREDRIVLDINDDWRELFSGKISSLLESALKDYLVNCRWFGSKARAIKSIRIQEIFPVDGGSSFALILFISVEYIDGEGETYTLPLAGTRSDRMREIKDNHPSAVVGGYTAKNSGEEGIIYDAIVDRNFCSALLSFIGKKQHKKGKSGEMVGFTAPEYRRTRKCQTEEFESYLLGSEQSNTSVIYGDKFILKFFRHLHEGRNPDLEIGRYLTEKGFDHVPSVIGSLEYHLGREEPATMAILQEYVQNRGDAWSYTLNVLGHYFEDILARHIGTEKLSGIKGTIMDLAESATPPEILDCLGTYLDSAHLLGQRTGELHLVLSSPTDDPLFSPEPFSRLYQRSLYQSMRTMTGQAFRILRRNIKKLPDGSREDARFVLEGREVILNIFQSLLNRKIETYRIRCHGDYHLGQVLYTGKDFVIIDFEGEPARPISERRIKRSPLRDVSGMIRSFNYAAHSVIFSLEARGMISQEDHTMLEEMAEIWHSWVSATFMKGYMEAVSGSTVLPHSREDLEVLLDCYLLEKAVYELGYELNNRPKWVNIPLRGIRKIIQNEIQKEG